MILRKVDSSALPAQNRPRVADISTEYVTTNDDHDYSSGSNTVQLSFNVEFLINIGKGLAERL